MKYSINPFKWLLWLWRRWKWRKRTRGEWRSFYRPAKPLSRNGKAEVVQKMKAAHEKTKFKPPDFKKMAEGDLERAIDLTDRIVKVNNSEVYQGLLQEFFATPSDLMSKAWGEWKKRNNESCVNKTAVGVSDCERPEND